MQNSDVNKVDTVQYLQMIENVIQRMANNCFQLKGWSLTIAGIMGVLISSNVSGEMMLFTLVPIVAFWFLDSYYLQLERKYRCLYDNVRNGVITGYDMNIRHIIPNKNEKIRLTYRKCLFSKVQMLYYFPVSGAMLAMSIIFMVTDC